MCIEADMSKHFFYSAMLLVLALIGTFQFFVCIASVGLDGIGSACTSNELQDLTSKPWGARFSEGQVDESTNYQLTSDIAK